MTKKRVTVPKATHEQVMKTFNHRCARCGNDRPQIHHIDEDPSNNDPMNLIPLCAYCHLTDQHDPTRLIEPEILKLFRTFRDPTILKPQFQPLFHRTQFLASVEDAPDMDALRGRVEELVDFISALEMGAFYSKYIQKLLEVPSYGFSMQYDDRASLQQVREEKKQIAKKHHSELRQARDQVYELVVELLRFQKW